MAKPRIFVSSTYYDLKHIRASLSLFIDSLGYESILFEKGQIAFISDDPLDISCYKEAEAADIFVLIIGGRYGSQVSESKVEKKDQYTEFNSITKREYDTASNNHVPTYILIEKGVYAEYQTFKLNQNSIEIKYAHVDSVNIFKLIDEIHNKPHNNPIFSFEKYNEIEDWLKEQWAGLFKDFLLKRTNIKKLDSLQGQIKNLEILNNTLKIYLETLLNNKNEEEKSTVVIEENKKLHTLKFKDLLKKNEVFKYILDINSLDSTDLKIIMDILVSAKNIDDFFQNLYNLRLPFSPNASKEDILEIVGRKGEGIKNILNELLEELKINPLDYKE